MSVSLNIPRSTTWETLQKSRNIAAVATLSSGLSSSVDDLRQLCIKSLIARHEPEARKAIILHWDNLVAADRNLVRQQAWLFVDTAKELLGHGSLSEKRLALAAIAELDLGDALDAMLDIVVDLKHPLCTQATECLMEMCERWGRKARDGRDSLAARGRMLEKLYARLAKFHEHKNLKLVDAWLCLVHWDDSLQRGLVADPRHEVYPSLIARFRECKHPAVIRLLAGYLWRPTTPKNLLGTISERPEPELAIEIAKMLVEEEVLNSALRRLQRIAPMQCLKHVEHALQSVNLEIEKRIWLLVAASSDDLALVLRGAVKLAKLGTREGRETAANMLNGCRPTDIETLVPAIRANALQLEQDSSSLGYLIIEIADWLHSPSVTLKQAASNFLQDFTVANLLEQVRHWPMEMCKAMANIVVIAESNCTEKLTAELQSPAPKRRLAALQVTQLLGCSREVSDALMPLLDDPRLEVRVRTIDLLGALGHEQLEQMIPELLADASTDIQDAAGRAVRRMLRHQQKSSVE